MTLALLLLLPSSSHIDAIKLQSEPTPFVSQPALSADGSKLCFSHQGNLWTVSTAGGVANRLTAADANDSAPKWSPDGKWIAFNSDREGGLEVYVVPATGGPARRITRHSVPTTLSGWFPDSKALVVTSVRETYRSSIYKLDVQTGAMTLMYEDERHCWAPAISPDGKWVAFARGAIREIYRKGYKGSANRDIYVGPVDGSAAPHAVTRTETNEDYPQWAPDSKNVYFVAETGRTSEIRRKGALGGSESIVIKANDEPMRFLSLAENGSKLAYEWDNRIGLNDAAGGSPTLLPIVCPTDERGPKATWATLTNSQVSDFTVSPKGKLGVAIVRGDIFLLNVEKGGETKRLTNTPGRERDVVWSPDGKSVAYSSTRDGTTKIWSVNVATGNETELSHGIGIDTLPQFSPDGTWIAFKRAPMSSYWIVKADGTEEQQILKGPKVDVFRWSPDGKYLAFVKENDVRTDDIWLTKLSFEGSKVTADTPINASNHPGFNEEMRWNPDGKSILFRSNRYRNRDIETINDAGRYALWSIALTPEKPKFDEEDEALKPTDPPKKPETEKPPVEVKIDPDEIDRRAKRLVEPEDSVDAFEISPDGKSVAYVCQVLGDTDLWLASTTPGGAPTRLTNGGLKPSNIEWAQDGSKVYFLSSGSLRSVAKTGGPVAAVPFIVRMEIQRTADYLAVFDEAWDIFNDRYYDRTFRGLDWKKIGARYRQQVPEVSCRRDFDILLQKLVGELNSSHTAAISPPPRQARETGYLGVWIDASFAGPGVKIREVMRRGPAEKDPSKLEVGETILEINGSPVTAGLSYDTAMEDQSGKTTTLVVLGKDGTTKRTAKIKPISRIAWSGLIYERWIDAKKSIVDKVSSSHIAYLHVSDMGDTARNRFEKELFSDGIHKDAIVLDMRNNNGGDTHDSLLKMLERNKHYFMMAPSQETPFPQPEHAVVRPVVVLINEFALSDAEVFANGFKELGLGPVVGTPTMGWIIFTSNLALVDGTIFRIPHLGCHTMDGRDMENWGVPPTIRVENDTESLREGRDLQLERAVQEAIKLAKKKS